MPASFYNRQPEPLKSMCLALRDIVLAAGPIEETLKYGIPYYVYHGPLVYITPNVKYPGAVLLGFARGTELSNESGILTSTELKVVRHIICRSMGDVDPERINPVLQEAMLVNELHARRKKR